MAESLKERIANANPREEAVKSAIASDHPLSDWMMANAISSLAWSFIRIGDLLERSLDMMEEPVE